MTDLYNVQSGAIKSERVKLIAIILLSWGLLLWQLGERSLWIDEFLTWRTINGTWAEVLAAATADIHPPLYFILLHGWVIVAGSTDFAMRLFSVMGGIVGLALVVPVSRKLAGSRVVVTAVLFLGLSPPFIEFSRMARYYVLLLSLGLLSTYLLLKALELNGWKNWLAYSLTCLALVYSFYPTVGLIGTHILLLWPYRHKTERLIGWSISIVVIGAGFLPWFLAVAGNRVLAGSGGADFSRNAIGFVLGIASSFYTFSVGETIFPWRPEAWFGLFLVFSLLGAGIFKWNDANYSWWQVMGLFIISILFLSTITTFINPGTPFLNVPVRGLFTLPYYILLVSMGLVSLSNQKWRMLFGTVLVLVWTVSIYNNFTGQQFLNPIYLTPSKEAAVFVGQNATVNDLVLSDDDSVFDYYFLANNATIRHLYTGQTKKMLMIFQMGKPERIWLVTLGRDQTRNTQPGGIRQQLQGAGYQLEVITPYLPIDPFYLKAKNFVLRRNSYKYRLTVETYIFDTG